MKLIFFFSICLLIATQLLLSMPGYDWQNTLAKFNGVHSFDTLNFIICGKDGRLIRTKDGGRTFKWIYTGTKESLNDIIFYDDAIGGIVSNTGTVLITSDSCRNWSKIKISDGKLLKIKFISKDVIIVCGEKGIFKSINRGMLWYKVYESDTKLITSLSFLNEEIGFASGYGGLILKTTDSGESWNPIIDILTYKFFNSIDFYDENYGIASYADTTKLSNSRRLLVTRNGGKNWDSIATNYNGPMFVKMFSDSECVALGWGGELIRTSDSWKTVSYDTLNRNDFYNLLQPLPGETQFSMSFDKINNGISIGNENSICILTNKATQNKIIKWSFMGGILGIANSYDITELEDNHLLRCTGSSMLEESFDGGNSWIHKYPVYLSYKTFQDSLYVGSITYKYAKIDNLISENNEIPINGIGYKDYGIDPNLRYKSIDYGHSWDTLNNVTAYPKATNYKQFCVSIDNSNQSPSYFISNDWGNNWNKYKLINKNESFLDVFVVNDSTCYFLTTQGVPTNDTINFPFKLKTLYKLLKSTDKGITFDTIYKEDNLLRTLYKVHFTDEMNGYLYGAKKNIIKTMDGGKSWEQIYTPLYFKRALLISDNLYLMSGIGDSIMYSTDQMKSWTIEKLAFIKDSTGKESSVNFNRIKKIRNGDIFLLGDNRAYKLAKIDTLTSVKSADTEIKYNPYFFITIYPQPIINTARITLYGLYSVKNLPISVKVFDIFGEEVMDLSEIANMQNDGAKSVFDFNTEALNKGVHFVQLTSGCYCKTEKFIKM